MNEYIEGNLFVLDIIAHSSSELRKIFEKKKESIKQKYGILIQELEIPNRQEQEGFAEYENTIGGRFFMRGIAKSAYLFLAYKIPSEQVLVVATCIDM
ncbi:hypothetical protein U27_00857 [Candidatus Vecturithrix granuli]|uniref:Uncharacterized protein n=1 Tax=Vecturithrix granuli TaxID=1499967 RepID=A0A081C8Q4_VECG1|nr:hypothetical protein U27_00857 [Candidatus Vecturithrix granuli]